MSDTLWQKIHEKMIIAARGRLPDPPPGSQMIRVSCEVAPAALRPLLEARRLTEAILGETRSGRTRPRTRTLFGDTPERATEAVVVELWNRLAKQNGARWVVVFDAVEQADEATLTALTRIVQQSGWLRLPLLLVFHGEPKEAAAELLAAVRARDGDSVVRGEEALASEAKSIQWSSLPPDVLRALRAGALIGPGFEIRILAELLSVDPELVLERLQHAIDLGVPVEDRGEGKFSLPSSALSALSASIIPSLAQAWHRKLGRLLGARAARTVPPPPPAPGIAGVAKFEAESVDDARVAEIIDMSHEVVDLASEAAEAASGTAGAGVDAGGRPAAPDTSRPQAISGEILDRVEPAQGTPPRRPVQRKTVLAPPAEGARSTRRKTLVLKPDVDMPAPVELTTTGRVATTTVGDPLIDNVRAAEHMRRAGDLDSAAEHLCEAAREAAEMGAPQAAVEHANGALALLATLPVGASRQRLKARALLELGRVQWQAPGYEHGFTLARACASLEAARAELDPDATVDLVVDLAQALAGVHFDLGDPPSLARALAEVEEASRVLHAANDPIGAACLFNDQAAVHVRMGDGAHALKLVRASRAIFDARAQDDPVALRELAESEHLLANLPLHARMRLGREEEGYAIGLDHALAAERAFRELDDDRELARVWETMGRLELKRLRLEEAKLRLEAAFEAQTRIGDLTGLAQTTEFLSEVLAWCGRNAEAITMLRDSVIYNRDKGSPRGLSSNRQAFTALSSRFAQLPQHADSLREVEILLAAGERELGVSRPPDATEGR
ncbi:hypothetical protein [Nannocystis radixulma]|uniref:MalT-like TPR region domain-containing protein n=1 Tax=Nannocystis radixulma TaxID=2995305 RepID=A0ABT5BG44_9BACT|nr:hypothetical protein [Nannocystis radixulma]MDC0672398.1 hypothetical protein [Nannocystis radixulma]